ncbi:TetR/AcrR family transcriptional regulator [Actinocorallia longicatena]|uniref:TetR/AcrR family transcriptional regulator n=1 Tax=Actinocorallia longicatena TaxID=111803 RepID=UPI0031E4248E
MIAALPGLPPVPPPALDPYLDAASRCFARFGLGHTSVQDVAKEMGVNRTTVYRQVGTVEQIALLLCARDVNRVLTSLPARLTGALGPEEVVDLVATVIDEAIAHPVLAKMLADERETIGVLFASEIPALLRSTAEIITPLVALTLSSSQIATRDPSVLAEWLVRIACSLVVAPPPTPLRPFLAELLLPALTP